MAINFGAGSTIYLKEEATYNADTAMTQANAEAGLVAKIRLRPGAIPNVVHNRVHARSTGGYMDSSHSYPVRKMVNGSYAFNIGSGPSQLLIHKWAGFDSVEEGGSTNNYENLKSFRVLHPIVEKVGEPIGVPYDGFIYQGMKVSQYSLNLPSDNSLLESVMTLVGAQMKDTIHTSDSLHVNEITLLDAEAAGTADTIKDTDPGAPFETWTASIKVDASYMAVHNFSINVNNGLIAGNYVSSGEFIGEPQTTGRTVTGQFTIPYDENGSVGGYKKFLDDLAAYSESTYDIEIQLKTSRTNDLTGSVAGKDTLTIIMPNVSILQGSTPGNLTAGYPQMSFSFRATGSRTVPNSNEIYITQA